MSINTIRMQWALALILASSLTCHNRVGAVAPTTTYVIPQRQAGDCINPNQVPATGLFPSSLIGTSASAAASTVQVVAATFFEVSYFNTYKVVRNNAVINGGPVNETYVLYQCGTAQPSASQFPSGAKFFEIPLKSISVPDTSAVAFLDALNVLDRVAFVTNYVDQPCMQALSGGVCNQLTLWSGDQNLTASGVDAVFNFGADAKNPRAIAFYATADPGPLNRAEWLKFTALFFNKEPAANKLYNTIKQTYTAIAAAANASAASPSKVIAWIQWWPNATYGSPCTNAEGVISFNYPAYKATLSQDAGARILDLSYLQQYVDAKQGSLGSSKMWLCANQSNVLRQILSRADIVVDEARYYYDYTNAAGTPDNQITITTFLARYGLNSSDINSLSFLKTNNLLREDGRTNPNSYTEWFERAVLRPDQVLADLIQSVNPAALQQPSLATALSTVQVSAPFFLRNLGQGQLAQVLTAASCSSLVACRYTPSAICPFVYKDCSGATVYSSDTQLCAPTCNVASNPTPTPTPTPGAAGAAARPLSRAALATLLLVLCWLMLAV